MTKIVSSLIAVLFSFAIVSNAHGVEQCPAINCDCDTLPNDRWVEVCKNHEARIKKLCVSNVNTPRDYCLIHGLNAKPLPLAIQFSKFELNAETNTEEVDNKINSIYWAVNSDMGAAKEAVQTKSYARALQILKLIDSNIDNLFEQQQKLEAAYMAKENASKGRSSWKKRSAETLRFTRDLHDFGTELASKIDVTTSSDKEKKIFGVLSQKLFRMAGKGYEHSGYALGKAERHKKAAETWKRAAGVAVQIADINKGIGGNDNSIEFSEFQAAARLHRASYHWLVENKIETSTEGLRESQLFVDREGQKNLEALVSNIEEDIQEGVLSGR